VEPSVDQRVPPAAAVGQEDPDMGVLDPPRGAGVLPRTPGQTHEIRRLNLGRLTG
jgi:hypothetical protein